MKLIRCKKCEDVVRLVHTEWRQCDCKKSGGQYNDDMISATIGGDCEVIGIRNDWFSGTQKDRSDKGLNGIIQGEYDGDVQIHRIDSGDGPKLKMDIVKLDGETNEITFTDDRKYTINVKGNKSPKTIEVPSNKKPSFKEKKSRNEGTKSLVKNLLREHFIIEAIKSGHWTRDSYPSRIETSTLKDMDPKHKAEIDKRLKFIETLEFSKGHGQKIGIWVYKTPVPVRHEPFEPRDKGPLLLAIINENNMTTLYWKHIQEGNYDYDISYNDLVEFSNSELYDAQRSPILISNIEAWVKSKRVVKPTKPRTDKFKKFKLPSGKVVRYYEILNKFETIDGAPIDMNDIFDTLPEQMQDMVLTKMDENENR